MALGALGIVLFAPAPTDGATGGLLYDEAARSLLRSSSRGGRDLARTVGDFGYRFMLAFPILDAIVTAGLIHGDFDAAFQIAAIDAEVIAFAGFVSLLLEHVLARARPSTAPCASDPDYEAFCSSADVHNSFPSGHTMIAAAGAGLTCVHHLKLPLYGGGAGDLAACAGAVAIALSVAVARIVNDRHWTTDVTVGLLLGGVAGYVWPALYHYRARAEKTTATWYWLPVATPDGVGGHVYGRF